jgi:hypothetical protein
MAKTAPVLPATIDSLLAKSGILIKRGEVWTYPGAENDPSGTNLTIPLEFVSGAVVDDALAKGDLVVRAADMLGTPTSVGKPSADGQPIRVVNMAQAGTSELGTETPPNSRPTHDAGRRIEPFDHDAGPVGLKQDQKPASGAPPAGAIAPVAPAK